MAGLVPAIHVVKRRNVAPKMWVPGTEAGHGECSIASG